MKFRIPHFFGFNSKAAQLVSVYVVRQWSTCCCLVSNNKQINVPKSKLEMALGKAVADGPLDPPHAYRKKRREKPHKYCSLPGNEI